MSSGAEQTRQELLCAAKEEFAEYGLAGARVDRIAEAAGVNKQRIYGHFGSKDGLFDAVLRQATIDAAAQKPMQPGDTPAQHASRTFEFHREHPQLLRLLLWEALSRPVESALSDAERQQRYVDKIDAFEAAGLDREDARHALLNVLALTSYTRLLPQMAALVLGSDYSEEDLKARVVDSLSRMVKPADEGAET